MLQNRLGNVCNIFNLAARIISPILKKQGINDARLIENWTEIIGKELSNKTIPLKITKNHKLNKKILHIAVPDSSVALMLNYQTNLILERIRLNFGCDFVQQIKITQISISLKEDIEEDMMHNPPSIPPINEIEDEEISKALSLLGSFIAAK